MIKFRRLAYPDTRPDYGAYVHEQISRKLPTLQQKRIIAIFAAPRPASLKKVEEAKVDLKSQKVLLGDDFVKRIKFAADSVAQSKDAANPPDNYRVVWGAISVAPHSSLNRQEVTRKLDEHIAKGLRLDPKVKQLLLNELPP